MLDSRQCALQRGARFYPLTNPQRSIWYSERAKFFENNVLPRFWDAQRGFIVTILDRVGPGIPKESNLDASVILASLIVNQHCPDNSVYSPTSFKVMSTALRLITTFQDLYPVNRRYTELCPAIGRFVRHLLILKDIQKILTME